MSSVKIGNIKIGNGEPCFIIAEAGVNHNGSVELAKKLIDSAKEAGVDAVKFQTFKAGAVVTPKADKAKYQKAAEEESQFEMLKKLELTKEDFRKLLMATLETPHRVLKQNYNYLVDICEQYAERKLVEFLKECGNQNIRLLKTHSKII